MHSNYENFNNFEFHFQSCTYTYITQCMINMSIHTFVKEYLAVTSFENILIRNIYILHVYM